MIIDLDFDEMDLESGVFAISVVNNPAMMSSFITLSDETAQMNLAAIDDKKMLLMGAVMIPDKVIPRANGTQIRFSKEVIRKSSEVFFKRGYHTQSTLEHNQDEKLEGMTVVESWIIEDSSKDKSSLYGLDLPIGTWMVAVKCDNDEVYEMAKQGMINGFSLEGVFGKRTISEEIDSYSNEELEALSALCEVAENLAETKEEAKEFIKQLIMHKNK